MQLNCNTPDAEIIAFERKQILIYRVLGDEQVRFRSWLPWLNGAKKEVLLVLLFILCFFFLSELTALMYLKLP